MAGDFDFLKELGLSTEDFKGKSKYEITQIVEEASRKRKAELEKEEEKSLLENIKTKLPGFKDQFKNPIKIFATGVGQSGKASEVSVIGYNPFNPEGKNYIVTKLKGDKVYQISENDMIKTESALAENRKKK